MTVLSCTRRIVMPWTTALLLAGSSAAQGSWDKITGDVNPPGGWQFSMAHDQARGVTVLHGDPDFTYEFDGTEWEAVTTPTPYSTDSTSLAYDSARGVMVSHGGWVSGVTNQTWEYDGTDWTLVSTSGPATSNAGEIFIRASMVYDVVTERMVLFSHSVGTWEYDGAICMWTQTADANKPGPLFSGAMAFDQALGKTILFTYRTTIPETWSYDGITRTWTRLHPAASPSARNRMEAEFDSSRGMVVIHGGAELMVPVNEETWHYDSQANTWLLDQTTNTLQRMNASMAYDDQRRRLVLFGGNSIHHPWEPEDTTWVYTAQVDTNFCQGVPNSTLRECRLLSMGPPSLSMNAFSLRAVDCVPDQPGIFLLGQSHALVPFGDGFRCVANPVSRLLPAARSNALGVASIPLDFTDPLLVIGASAITSGTAWKFQYLYRDPFLAGGTGLNLSNGLSIVFMP